MILVGAWIALIGYGVLYAGINKLGGGGCGLRQAFSIDGCNASAPISPTIPGSTAADRAAAAATQQETLIPAPIPATPTPVLGPR